MKTKAKLRRVSAIYETIIPTYRLLLILLLNINTLLRGFVSVFSCFKIYNTFYTVIKPGCYHVMQVVKRRTTK